MRNQYKLLAEKYEQVNEDAREVGQIVNKARTLTQGYITLLNNKKISGIQLGEYKHKNIDPLINFICSYIQHSTPQEMAKFKQYLIELLTTTWLQVDKQYWEEEINKLVTGAVDYGEVDLENLEDLANQGNKHIKESEDDNLLAGIDIITGAQEKPQQILKKIYDYVMKYHTFATQPNRRIEVLKKYKSTVARIDNLLKELTSAMEYLRPNVSPTQPFYSLKDDVQMLRKEILWRLLDDAQTFKTEVLAQYSKELLDTAYDAFYNVRSFGEREIDNKFYELYKKYHPKNYHSASSIWDPDVGSPDVG